MHAVLVERLRARVRHNILQADPFAECDSLQVATAETLDWAEAELGFPLPPLVRALYAGVGDGGWGPGAGLLPLAGEQGLVDETLWCQRYARGPAGTRWPARLVHVVGWGCLYSSCVDCSDPACPVVFYDGDHAILEGATTDDYLDPEADSLAGYLEAWLAGADLVASRQARRGLTGRA